MAVTGSNLPVANTMAANDIFIIVTTPGSAGVTKRISANNLFGAMSTSLVVQNTASVVNTFTANTGNTYFSNVHISYDVTPVSSLWAAEKGQIWYDTNYIYIAVGTNNVKRVALSSF
jgi:hypothetical protein